MSAMIRLRIVHSVLLEDIAELTPPVDSGDERAAIAKARLRAGIVGGLSCLAILVLFAFRSSGRPFLVLGASEDGLFTLGVLVVAIHAGYRLGQMQKLGAVLRAWDSLPRAQQPDRQSNLS